MQGWGPTGNNLQASNRTPESTLRCLFQNFPKPEKSIRMISLKIYPEFGTGLEFTQNLSGSGTGLPQKWGFLKFELVFRSLAPGRFYKTLYQAVR